MIERLVIFTPTWLKEDGEPNIPTEVRETIEMQHLGCEWEWWIGTDNPFPVPDHRNVLHQYQAALAQFLAGDYTALLTIEHDNLLPDECAVQRLLDTEAEVVYALYLLRHSRPPILSTWRWVSNRQLGRTLSDYPYELRRARQAKVWKVCGAGNGCTLFRRRVLEQIGFVATSPQNPCPDLGFAKAALAAGDVSMGRFDVPVAHLINGEWREPFEVKQRRNKVR